MASLKNERDTKKLAGAGQEVDINEWPQKGNTLIFAGAQVCLDANKLAIPGIEATGLTAMGRCEETSDATGLPDGAVKVKVRGGAYKWQNNPGAVAGETVDKLGVACFVLDDQSVVKTDGGAKRSQSGVVHRIDSDGVYVRQGLTP